MGDGECAQTPQLLMIMMSSLCLSPHLLCSGLFTTLYHLTLLHACVRYFDDITSFFPFYVTSKMANISFTHLMREGQVSYLLYNSSPRTFFILADKHMRQSSYLWLKISSRFVQHRSSSQLSRRSRTDTPLLLHITRLFWGGVGGGYAILRATYAVRRTGC